MDLHTRRMAAVVSVSAALFMTAAAALAQADDNWSGNLLRNPGFEEDFVNVNAEGQVLSFKGDWYYNQQDFVPDYWTLTRNRSAAKPGEWEWIETQPKSGERVLRLIEGTTASQSFPRAIAHEGGGPWGGVASTKMTVDPAHLPRFNTPLRASAYVRGGGTLSVNGVSATAEGGDSWQLLTVTVPAEQVGDPSSDITLTLTGPGEFDDVVLQEQYPDSPNLAANTSFEQVDADGYPKQWSEQEKFRAIGPTYYVWTDWNHVFQPNRGPVTTDTLVSHTGGRSLRFDVNPGDEKYVESDLIVLNQKSASVIEVGVFVRADKVNMIDVRCVDQDGLYMPGVRPRQPEWKGGGSFLYGNGTFGWRYVRKFFTTLDGGPVRGVRVRLCARGFNAHTLDDFGTRPYSMATGTVWWDDVRVFERTSTAGELQQRGVKIPAANKPPVGKVAQGAVDLGERFWGENELAYTFVNHAGGGRFQLRVTTTFPGGEGRETVSDTVNAKDGDRLTLTASYIVDQLADDLENPATFHVELLRNGSAVEDATYRFHTWPVVADIDVGRAYSHPNETPVTTSINLGVAQATLAKTRTVEVRLEHIADGKVVNTQKFADLPRVFAASRAQVPGAMSESFEFDMPAPKFGADHTNLIITQVDISKLKVWPYNYPMRDHRLVVRGLDGSGKTLFEQTSDGFGRVQPAPKKPAIKTVEIRDDGALLINGKPHLIFAGSGHPSNRIQSYSLSQLSQLDNDFRLLHGATFEHMQSLWHDHTMYIAQAKPVAGMGSTAPVVDMNDEQKQALEQFVKSGGMENIISFNTGGWEATIDPYNEDTVAKHKALNDWVRQATNRPVSISTSGAYNAWWLPKLAYYDINHAETEMWGPMDYNVVWTPYMKRAGLSTAWVYLPQLYDNHPFERYRFETYENIIRGSVGVEWIQGIGDPTFHRGLMGELRYLEAPLFSREKAPEVTFAPANLSHRVTRHEGKTYILATNCGPVATGKWEWNEQEKHSGRASHEGDSWNTYWVRPGGLRIHGFRGMPMPEMIQSGDKIVQYVWLDPQETPEWVALAVRGDGRFAHNGTLGKFDFKTFRDNWGNVRMFSELNHSVWHEIANAVDDEVYELAKKIMTEADANTLKARADAGRKKVDERVYQPEHFHNLGSLPKAGQWVRIELDADEAGLVGKLVDGFAYLTNGGRALWDYTALERGGEVVRVFSEDAVGIDREELAEVRINVPGLKKGTKVKVLFEGREIIAEDGYFVDEFVGTDTYGYEATAPEGDLLPYPDIHATRKDEDKVLPRMLPSGHGYNYGPTAVHIYEIEH